METENDLNEANQALVGVNMSKCECADILASVFPQLVIHWSAAGNKLKTFRYGRTPPTHIHPTYPYTPPTHIPHLPIHPPTYIPPPTHIPHLPLYPTYPYTFHLPILSTCPCSNSRALTSRYLTESGAAALATCNNMQALSYLHDVQDMLQEEGQNFVANSEEKARVESLIGQVD